VHSEYGKDATVLLGGVFCTDYKLFVVHEQINNSFQIQNFCHTLQKYKLLQRLNTASATHLR